MPKKNICQTVSALFFPLSFTAFMFFCIPGMERVDSAYKAVFICALYAVMTACVPIYFTVRKKLCDPVAVFFIGSAVTIAMCIRLALMDHVSTDYAVYLDIWTDAMREQKGLGGLALNVSDYNMPYLYFLEAIAKLVPEHLAMYITKTVSVAFEFVLAYFIMQLVGLVKNDLRTKYLVFCGVLLVPTFILDGAYWCQCDMIYGAFAAGFVNYALSGRPNLSALFFGLAISFKLQAIFAAPMILVFLFVKKLKIKHLLWIPAVYLALLVPAVIAGKPIIEALTVYLHQAAEYPVLLINAPSIYQFVHDVDYNSFKTAGIILSGCAAAVFLFFLFKNRETLGTGSLLFAAFVFALGLPLLLPCMHERYFFLVDVFCIVIPFINRKLWYIPLCCFYVKFPNICLFFKKHDVQNHETLL